MKSNWSLFSNPSFNYDDSGSRSNTHPDFSGVYKTVDRDGNGMGQETYPYTQHELGHKGQTLYSTSNVRPTTIN